MGGFEIRNIYLNFTFGVIRIAEYSYFIKLNLECLVSTKKKKKKEYAFDSIVSFGFVV